MKKLLIFLASVCLVACQQSQQQYFESSPEINIVKKGVQSYLKQDWTTFRTMYADTAKIAANTWDPANFIGVEQHISNEREAVANFSEIKISDDAVYCMVVNNKGERWVLMWFGWNGTTTNGAKVTLAVHEGLRFVGDKVVFHFATFDATPIYQALQPADSVAKQ